MHSGSPYFQTFEGVMNAFGKYLLSTIPETDAFMESLLPTIPEIDAFGESLHPTIQQSDRCIWGVHTSNNSRE